MPRTALVADPTVRNHDPGPQHPEQPGRYTAVLDALENAGLLNQLDRLPPRAAHDDELTLVHSQDYVALIGQEVQAGRRQLSTGDTDIMAASDTVARLATGGVLSAVDAVCSGTVQNAFCAVRPPGHHATADRGMGFCLYNSVAVAARYGQKYMGPGSRVAIVDWDVHHGNGTQDIFYQDGSVLFFSTHEWPLYPGTGAASEQGEGAGAGLTINNPFPAGAGRSEILGAFEDQFFPALAAFRPDLILISAGFDSRVDDLLGHFRLTDADFADLTERLMQAAELLCKGRLVSVLEGGYNLHGLGLAAAAHVKSLLGQ